MDEGFAAAAAIDEHDGKRPSTPACFCGRFLEVAGTTSARLQGILGQNVLDAEHFHLAAGSSRSVAQRRVEPPRRIRYAEAMETSRQFRTLNEMTPREYHARRDAARLAQREELRLRRLAEIRDAIARLAPLHPAIKAAHLFGSVLRPGSFTERSDIDVAIDCDDPAEESRFGRGGSAPPAADVYGADGEVSWLCGGAFAKTGLKRCVSIDRSFDRSPKTYVKHASHVKAMSGSNVFLR